MGALGALACFLLVFAAINGILYPFGDSPPVWLAAALFVLWLPATVVILGFFGRASSAIRARAALRATALLSEAMCGADQQQRTLAARQGRVDGALLQKWTAAQVQSAWATVMAARAAASATRHPAGDPAAVAASVTAIGSIHLQALIACDALRDMERASQDPQGAMHALGSNLAAATSFVADHPRHATGAAVRTYLGREASACVGLVLLVLGAVAGVQVGGTGGAWVMLGGIAAAIAAMVQLRTRAAAVDIAWSVAVYHAVCDGFCPAAFAGTWLADAAAAAAADAAVARDEELEGILREERRFDQRRSTTQLLEELQRYSTAEEVARVRRLVALGRFPAARLDDLVHHRREAHLRRGAA